MSNLKQCCKCQRPYLIDQPHDCRLEPLPFLKAVIDENEECPKCGNPTLDRTYIPEGKLINSSSLMPVDDEFIRSTEYEIYFSLKAKKEHLVFHCPSCGYEWRRNTKGK